uniref:TGS domain-containing protein n=1 Tax=Romanomermis culicivorax TaxID=13658 RepID=A0A915HPJ3_ROMCU
MPCLYVYNKIDQICMEEVDRLARLEHSVVISCNLNLNLDYLLERLWSTLNLIRIYTKKPGQPPDLEPENALILRQGQSTVENACQLVHKSLVQQFKYAIVWGQSPKFSPQRVGVNHCLADEDVIQIMKK